MGFLQQAWAEKTVYGVETHWLSNKEKVIGAAVNKDDIDSLRAHERTHHYWFPWKNATVNSASYCQQLRQNSLYLLNDLRIDR